MIGYILYFLISVAATLAGSMTGMGGGVIIKPMLDIINEFDVATIGVLSSMTVLSMTLVSVWTQVRQGVVFNLDITIPLAIGSVLGGSIGQYLLVELISVLNNNRLVLLVQNAILGTLVIGVFFYMLNRSKISTLEIKSIVLVVTTGIFLGAVSAFLGIGGGPLNVSLLIILFSLDIKTATICSVIIIMFAQLSNLFQVAANTGFRVYDLSMLLPMIIGATIGGFIGSWLNKRLSEKTIGICFNGVQVLVFVFCIYNIITNLE